MDEPQLRALVKSEQASAIGSDQSSELAHQRARNIDYYLGDVSAYIPSIDGRSKAFDTTVSDAIDEVMPSLMEIFTAGDEICVFSPTGPEDEEAAKQETDFVNHVFMEDNPGFVILHTMIKDALLQKNGIVKFWFEEGEEGEKEEYEGLDANAFALLAADVQNGSVRIVELEEEVDEATGQVTYDVTVTRTSEYGKVVVEPVPPEEFGISKMARAIADSPYCYHRTKLPAYQLKQLYPKKAEKIEEIAGGDHVATIEQQARATVIDDNENEDGNGALNRAMRSIVVTEHYIRVDWNDDGIAELRKVVTVGPSDEIFENEEIEYMPFAGITPILMSHRFTGRSLADTLIDIANIKTQLLRALLDNAWFMNNQRVEVSESHATDNTLDDLLTNRPGGLVRTKQPGGLNVIPSNPVGQHIMPTLEYMDQQREKRIGVPRMSPGPDANSLNAFGSTATGVNAMTSSAYQRIRFIARVFAETGIKELFLGIHALLLKYGTEARTVKMRGQWVTVDPRQWKKRTDMTVQVGLGTGSREMVAGYLNNILNIQVQAIQMQGGPNGPVVSLKNIYHTLKKMVENAGFNTAELFFTDPTNAPPQPPRQDPTMAMAQAQMQIEQQKAQAQLAIKQQDAQLSAQLERERAQQKAQIETIQAQADMTVQQRKAELEFGLERQRAALQMELDQKRAEFDLQIKAIEAQIKANERQAAFQHSAMLERAKTDSQIKTNESESQAKVLGAALDGFTAAITKINSPKKVKRGPDGRVEGIE